VKRKVLKDDEGGNSSMKASEHEQKRQRASLLFGVHSGIFEGELYREEEAVYDKQKRR